MITVSGSLQWRENGPNIVNCKSLLGESLSQASLFLQQPSLLLMLELKWPGLNIDGTGNLLISPSYSTEKKNKTLPMLSRPYLSLVLFLTN